MSEQEVRDAMDRAARDAEEQARQPHGVPFEAPSTQQPKLYRDDPDGSGVT